MPRTPVRQRRALTLLELILAVSVTAMVAAAIASMLAAVSAGVVTKRDARSLMVHANAAQSRLGSYIGPSRCFLEIGESNVVLWLLDSRKSDSVHATEIRWLLFDASTNSIDVHFVKFPDGWSQASKDIADQEYSMTTNWSNVLVSYDSSGWISSYTLVDGLVSVSVVSDAGNPVDAEHLAYELGIETGGGTAAITVSSTVHLRRPPSF